MSLTSVRDMSMSSWIKFTSLVIGLVVALVSCSNEGLHPKLRVGDPVPKSDNRVVTDVNDWREVSTMDTKVPLYRWRIADLIEQGKPFLIVFGTPQHCTMCVDQIVRVAVMQEKYGDRFAFIHIDGYKDNPVWVEWGIKGEPWTFVVNSQGRVSKIFPGQTELSLLEQQIQLLIKEAG